MMLLLLMMLMMMMTMMMMMMMMMLLMMMLFYHLSDPPHLVSRTQGRGWRHSHRPHLAAAAIARECVCGLGEFGDAVRGFTRGETMSYTPTPYFFSLHVTILCTTLHYTTLHYTTTFWLPPAPPHPPHAKHKCLLPLVPLVAKTSLGISDSHAWGETPATTGRAWQGEKNTTGGNVATTRVVKTGGRERAGDCLVDSRTYWCIWTDVYIWQTRLSI